MKVHSNVDLNDPLVFKLWTKAVSDALNVEDKHNVGGTNEPAFEGTWTNYDTPTATSRDARFYKDHFGRVHLEGVVGGGTSGTTAFTLPDGYRPSVDNHAFRCESSPANAVIVVASDGTVKIYTGTTYTHLDGVSFRT